MQIEFEFLSVLKLRDHSKWKTKENEHGGGNNAHPNVRSESNE